LSLALPPPYRAALALSIDSDGCTIQRLHRVLGYWATEEATPLGRGLNLPVAASMFGYSRNPEAPPQAAYLDGDRDGLREAWRRGWIDTLHSVGDFAADRPCTRDLAKRAFDALAEDQVRLTVWTNHGGPHNIQDLLLPASQGDVPGSSCYLSDLAFDYGIRFAWTSELTPLIGQGREATAGEYYSTYPGKSGWARRTARLAHAISRGVVRKLGVEPYPGNSLVEPRTLRDGRRILSFRRYGRWRHDTIARLPSILSREVLDRLIENGGAMIVYLHIGPSKDETPQNLRDGLKALDEVAKRVRGGSLEVLKTVDLLDREALVQQ
jgi:hypothetical protein